MFEIISEGNVYLVKGPTGKAAGSRTAVLPDGRLACTFTMNAKTGANQFVPMIAYSDDGEAWSEAVPMFPEVIGKESIFGAIRKTHDGRVSYAGTTTPISSPDEMFWSDEIGGMLENKILYTISSDGYTFPPYKTVDLPYYGSAELPGGMLVEEDGKISILYSPYRATQMRGETDVCQMTVMKSDDDGKTFRSLSVGRAPEPCQYGEAWLVKLKNGVEVISTWQTARVEGSDQYLLSFDGGESFTEPMLFPFNGQSTAAEPYGEDEVLIIYNQRKDAPIGVWLARAKVEGKSLRVVANECIWRAEEATKNQTSGEFDEWTSFAFGEPHVCVLPTGELLATLWYDQRGTKGIRYVKIRVKE